MIRKFLSLFLTIAIVMTAACALAEGGVIVTDMRGRTVSFERPAERVVVLSAADCEIIYALGAGEKIVGRGEYCDYPAEVLELPVVNSGAETNIEQLLALAPEVVIMPDMAQTKEQVEALENAGVRVVVSYATSIEGVYTAIEMIGAILGRDAEAAALVGEMKAAFEEIAAASLESEATGKTVYFEISPLEWGLWTGGAGTFMDELGALCGLTNIFADVEGWAEISEEQVIERNPDYIVSTMMYFGEGLTPVEEILSRAGWSGMTAVENGDVFNADNDEVTRPGPRLMDAARSLYNFVNGIVDEEAVEPVDEATQSLN